MKQKFAWNYWLLAVAAGIGFFVILLGCVGSAFGEERTYEEEKLLTSLTNGEVVRLHVIANSNSSYDQAVKLYVRDCVIRAFGKIFCSTAEQHADSVFETLCNEVDEIRQTACEAVNAVGCRLPIQAQAGILELPAKTYGSVTLPKGKYRALRITIGSGEGNNWWCVLFPKLCLSLSEDRSFLETGICWHSERILANWLCSLPSAFQRKENML